MKVELPAGRVAYWLGGPADHARKDVWKPGNPCPVNFDVYYNGRIGGTITPESRIACSGVLNLPILVHIKAARAPHALAVEVITSAPSTT